MWGSLSSYIIRNDKEPAPSNFTRRSDGEKSIHTRTTLENWLNPQREREKRWAIAEDSQTGHGSRLGVLQPWDLVQ